MSRHNNLDDCGRNAPSAPPIHMMPGNNLGPSNTNEPLYREPPPSYQEAIEDDTPLNPIRILKNRSNDPISRQGRSLSSTTYDRRRLPSPTYHLTNIAPSSQSNDDYTNFPSSNRRRQLQEERQLQVQQRYLRQTGSLTGSIERLDGRNIINTATRRDGAGSRYRSASPSELSEGAQDESQERCTSNESGNKKKGSGSKIKKGLENIAFFIIQILD